MHPGINIYGGVNLISEHLGQFLAEISSNQSVNIALAGGKTPYAIFKYLSDHYQNKIRWENFDFYWGDERCVPENHPDSNYLMAKTSLFEPLKVNENKIHRIRGESSPGDEAKRYSNSLESIYKVNHLPCFDVILLGMGEDGHTASIFPDQMELLVSDQWCAVAQHPVSGQTRITLTGKVINNAHHIIFIISGKSKASIAQTIIMRQNEFLLYPAGHINPFHGKLYWILDSESSVKL